MIKIPPEEAYGEYDEANIQTIPLEDLGLPEPPVEGQKLMTMYGTRVTVLEVNETHVTIDFNHELAGKTLIFDVTLVSIESS